MRQLHRHLALFDYVTSLLGGDADALGAILKDTPEEEGPDGRSSFHAEIVSRRGAMLRLGDGELERYDVNIMRHERELRRHRPGFRLRYFQYLAALFTEIVLDRLTRDSAGFLVDLEAHRRDRFPELPPYKAETLRTLAFWMATGSGKTLLMHVNLHQVFDYFRDAFRNVLLLVPTETLRDQHLKELRASGLDAAFALDADAVRSRVQVLEITKLYVEGRRQRQGGVSVPTSIFEGPNLLLVDEGHKGTRTKTDRETEQQWRAIRDDLAGVGGPAAHAGLTLEYSATFAQVTDGDDELFHDYARQTMYEYAYRRFHGDGFGKDYRAINVQQDPELYGERLLLGGLLTFYEKQRLFDAMPEAAATFNVANPLMLFVTSRVTGGPELVDVLSFLDRVLRDEAWTTAGIDALLRARSGLPGPDGRDAFEHAFPYLKRLNATTADLYADLRARVFYGAGRLTLVPLADAPGEVGLRASAADKDRFFGVVNVGDAAKLVKKVQAEAGIPVSPETPFTGSLFDSIGEDGSPLRVLIGAQKFTEGWSTPRVSVMGLMNVGANAGARVLQLFGRGVRLRGVHGLMRRADTVVGTEIPPHLDRLETLDIFGVRANYLKRFLDTLRREGAPLPVLRVLPLFTEDEAIRKAELRTLRVEEGYDFTAAETIDFEPDTLGRSVALDLTPKVMTADARESRVAAVGLTPMPIPPRTLAMLDVEGLYYHALAYKTRRAWHNLRISREAIERALKNKARLLAPTEVLDPTAPAHLDVLDAAARTLVEKLIDAFYNGERQRHETERLVTYPLRSDDPNFPRMTVRESQGRTYEARAYRLSVPESMLAEVDALLADAAKLREEASGQPLPRMHVSPHLYLPLLTEGPFTEIGGALRVPKPPTDTDRVRSSPPGLVDGEVRFLHDLRAFWATRDVESWGETDLFILRNLPHAGVGFFGTAGFYPDFLLWMKDGENQALAFVDPKGLRHWSEDKVALLDTIRRQTERVGFPLFGFIVTHTPMETIAPPGIALADVPGFLAARHILHQERDGYVEDLLSTLRLSLEEPVPT